ncbi:hypothetical protein C8J56DRAFT_1082941, partial [Mycena floridula]
CDLSIQPIDLSIQLIDLAFALSTSKQQRLEEGLERAPTTYLLTMFMSEQIYQIPRISQCHRVGEKVRTKLYAQRLDVTIAEDIPKRSWSRYKPMNRAEYSAMGNGKWKNQFCVKMLQVRRLGSTRVLEVDSKRVCNEFESKVLSCRERDMQLDGPMSYYSAVNLSYERQESNANADRDCFDRPMSLNCGVTAAITPLACVRGCVR